MQLDTVSLVYAMNSRASVIRYEATEICDRDQNMNRLVDCEYVLCLMINNKLLFARVFMFNCRQTDDCV